MRESPPMADELTITRPDDWHLHVRDGAALAAVVPASARQFGRAIIMPNLKPPVTTTQAALAYRDRIVAAVPPDASFEPLMTLYLTDTLGADEIRRAREAGIAAVKLYPAGATTNSDAGVTALRKTYGALEAMQRDRHAAAGPRRGHRSRGRPVRPRAGLPRDPADPVAQRLPGAEDRDGAHHDARGGAVRRRGRRPDRGDDHRAPPALQPQRDLPRRHPAALLLPAGAEARDASARAGRGGDVGP